MRPHVVGLLLAATAFVAPTAWAQTAPAPDQSSSTEAAPTAEQASAGDIIVTAQRRNESLQRVPVSLTAVTADTITSRNLNDLTQVARAAPSLQVGQDNTFAIRGVGTLSFAGTTDSSVALAIDEVNLGRPLLNSPLLNDLARVEVLNGPQGLLFGKNASAGLLNIVTNRPVFGEYSSAANIEAASRDTLGADRAASSVIARETLNIPLSARSALRLSALYSYQEPGTTYVGKPDAGTRHDLNLQTFSIKGKYLAQLGDHLELYVIGDYNENHGIAGAFDNTYRAIDPSSISIGALAYDGITPGAENLRFGGNATQFRDIATGGAQAKLTYSSTGGIEISNLFAWRFYDQNQSFDADYLSLNAFDKSATQARYDQYSNEFRVALPADNRLSGQAGLYYFNSSLHLARQQGGNNYQGAGAIAYPFCVGAVAVPGAFPPTCSVSNVAVLGSDINYRLNTESYAAFGQLTFNVTDALKLIGGGRVTRDRVTINEAQNQLNYFSPLAGPRGVFASQYANTDFSWKLGAQYQVTPTIMTYGFYGRGYKGPGFNDAFPTLTANVVVLPEHSNTAEIGVKSSFLDRRVTANISLFHTKFDDFQVQAFNATTVSFQVQNAGRVTSKGVEASVTVVPVRGLTLNGAASLLSSKFDEFPGAQCYPTQTTRGCSATVSTFDAAGLTLPDAPKFTSTVSALYEVNTDGAVRPFLQGDWYHRSSINYLVNQAPGASFGTLDVFGASVGARFGGVRVALFCKNCTNKIYPTAINVDSGDANARNNRGVATPKLSYTQQWGLDSTRAIGVNLGFNF